MIAFGERAGQPVRRIRVRTDQEKARICGDRVAEFNWFNLKADKVVKSHQRWKLARLVRYIARPPLAHERLDMAEDGTVRYKMKKPCVSAELARERRHSRNPTVGRRAD
jgi:hypothetical protein